MQVILFLALQRMATQRCPLSGLGQSTVDLLSPIDTASPEIGESLADQTTVP